MKLLFLDLDDTLLCSDKTISKKNLDAIRNMTENGHGLVLATGRPFYSCMKLAKEYGFVGKNYYIAAFNGGQIVDTSSMKEIYHAGLDKENARFIFDEAHKFNIPVQTYSDEFVLTERENEFIKWYTERIRMPYKVVPDAIEAVGANPFKCVAGHIDDHEALEKFQNYISPKLSENVITLFSNPHILEFGPLNASKGIAVKVLCEKLKVDLKDSIAAGDEENDISMIETAGIGVAMKNGTEHTKNFADYITENDNDNDAIAEIIYKFIL